MQTPVATLPSILEVSLHVLLSSYPLGPKQGQQLTEAHTALLQQQQIISLALACVSTSTGSQKLT